VEDRPPYAVWVIGGLVVWAFILAGFMVWDLHSTSRTAIWAIFAGWCIGVLGASIARKIYSKAPSLLIVDLTHPAGVLSPAQSRRSAPRTKAAQPSKLTGQT
jgi:hypothetical protein